MARELVKDAFFKGCHKIFSRRLSHYAAEPIQIGEIEDVSHANSFSYTYSGPSSCSSSSIVEEDNCLLYMPEEYIPARGSTEGLEACSDMQGFLHLSQKDSDESCGVVSRLMMRSKLLKKTVVAEWVSLGSFGFGPSMQMSCSVGTLDSGGTCTIGKSGALSLSEKNIAFMNTEQFLLSLAVASQFHDKVIRSSIQSFDMIDMSHSLQVWSVLRSNLSSSPPKELSAPSQSQKPPSPSDPSFALEREDPTMTFVDDDGIRIAKILKEGSNEAEESVDYSVSIPREMMRAMPAAPNNLDNCPPGDEFAIHVKMAPLDQVDLVNSCIKWLLKDRPGTSSFLGLVCKYGSERSPSLVQLSLLERCVLITLPSRKFLTDRCNPSELKAILSNTDILKVGAEVHRDALALFHFLGLVSNCCIKISHLSTGQKRKKGVLSIFRDLFNWGWTEKKKILNSDWESDLMLDQVKFAALETWSARLIWARQIDIWKGEAPFFSLKNMPYELLNYFGRSMFSPGESSRKDRDTAVEVTGAKIEVHKGFLKLQQTHFRSRVLGLNSTVELRFKDGREPEKYLTMVRRGNKVVLDPERSESSKKPQEIDIDVEMISKVLVDNSDNDDVQRRKLEDVLYYLLCTPPACPPHILVALGCSIDTVGVKPKVFDLDQACLDSCKEGLNLSQLTAWTHMLSNPMAAVIGPPGTGKTTLIKSVAKAWEHLGGTGETLLCVAHQNVAVRHMAESMLREGIPGVLLLISEDYYVDWHEEQYTQVKDAIVIAGPQTMAGMKTWAFRNKVTVPKVILCTLAVIGSQSFYSSLMGTKVSYLIIDECSQAAEGHLISNLVCLPHLQMLSVLGDPSQLPPYGKPLQSVFDLVSGSCLIKFLHEQYRMPYCISKFVSEEFYHGRLETVFRAEQREHTAAPKPLLWINIRGIPRQASGTKKSLCNPAEAEAILEYCIEYKRRADEAGMQLTLGKLIILTLYEGQRTMISRLLNENDLHIIPVYNVDSFQGQEADAVLISLVVGDRGSAFAVDRNRACVLLSRAKRLMHVFGNLDSVVSSRLADPSKIDSIWRSLASYCETNEWVASEAEIAKVVRSLF